MDPTKSIGTFKLYSKEKCSYLFFNFFRFEDFLKRHARLLHPNHWLFTSARHSLSQLYGRDERYLLGTLSSEQLERKTAICQSLLAVIDIVEPGLSRLRGTHYCYYYIYLNNYRLNIKSGVTLYEMHAPVLLLARRHYEAGKCSTDELKDRVDHVRRMLSEATRILSLEDPASREGIMGAAAVQALDQIQRWIISI